jgi:hypothetical protein
MVLRDRNDRKGLEARASARARDGFAAVLFLRTTEDAANSGHLLSPSPCKPDGLLRTSRKHLMTEFPRVKMTSVCESTA